MSIGALTSGAFRRIILPDGSAREVADPRAGEGQGTPQGLQGAQRQGPGCCGPGCRCCDRLETNRTDPGKATARRLGRADAGRFRPEPMARSAQPRPQGQGTEAEPEPMRAQGPQQRRAPRGQLARQARAQRSQRTRAQQSRGQAQRTQQARQQQAQARQRARRSQRPQQPERTPAPAAGVPGANSSNRERLNYAMRRARELGLRITSTTGGRHAPNSYHYRGRAVDVAGSPQRMAQFYREMAQMRPTELFYDPIGGMKHGRNIGPIGGHRNHVHVAF